jgi:hypothetical protein
VERWRRRRGRVGGGGVDGGDVGAMTSAAVASAAVESAATASACLAGGGVRRAALERPNTFTSGFGPSSRGPWFGDILSHILGILPEFSKTFC